MMVPLLLVIVSLAGLAAALTLPDMADFVLLAGPCLLAGLILLLLAWWQPKPPGPVASPAPVPRDLGLRLSRHPRQRWILIDGSNVLHWKDNTPQIDTLREVVVRLTTLGYSPAVVFDANAGYLISGKYQHDKALGDLLALNEDRVMVVRRGEPADPVLLVAARNLGARIVTNDRYRDWAEAHPEVHAPGFLIRGAYRDGMLWLDLQEMAVA